MCVVYTVFRLSTILLGDASGDVQESDELAGDAHLSSRSAYFRKGQRPHSQVGPLGSHLHFAYFSSIRSAFVVVSLQ